MRTVLGTGQDKNLPADVYGSKPRGVLMPFYYAGVAIAINSTVRQDKIRVVPLAG